MKDALIEPQCQSVREIRRDRGDYQWETNSLDWGLTAL